MRLENITAGSMPPLVVGIYLNGEYTAIVVKQERPSPFFLPLWRGDYRSPEVIFKNGFVSWGSNTNFTLHVNGTTCGYEGESAFISTSEYMYVSKNFAQSGWIYEINPKITDIDVNKWLGNESPYPFEYEIAKPFRISSSDIKSAYNVCTKTKILNPNYKPPITLLLPLREKVRNTLLKNGEKNISCVIDLTNNLGLQSIPFIDHPFYKLMSSNGVAIIYSIEDTSSTLLFETFKNTQDKNLKIDSNNSVLNLVQKADECSLGLGVSIGNFGDNPSKILSQAYRVSKFTERFGKFNGSSVSQLSSFNLALKRARYFSTFRDGELFKVPFDFANGYGRSSFFKFSPKTFLIIDAAAMLVEGVAPLLMENIAPLINKHENFAISAYSHLPEVQRNFLEYDSLAEDVRNANHQLKGLYTVAHLWSGLPRYLYEKFIPNQWKQTTQNFRESVHDLNHAILAHHIERQNINETYAIEQDFDTDCPCPFTLRDVSNFLNVIQAPVVKNDTSATQIDDQSHVDCDTNATVETEDASLFYAQEPLQYHTEKSAKPNLVKQHQKAPANYGTFNTTWRAASNGQFVGVSWTPPNSNLNFEFGFSFDHNDTDAFVTKLLNRAFGVSSGSSAIYFAGHKYGYKIHEYNGSADITIYPIPEAIAKDRGKKVIPCDLHFLSGVWKANTKKDFNVEQWRANTINRTLMKALMPYINDNFREDSFKLSTYINDKLANGQFTEAKQELFNFYNKCSDHPSVIELYEEGLAACDFQELITKFNELPLQEDSYSTMENLINEFEHQHQNVPGITNIVGNLRDKILEAKDKTNQVMLEAAVKAESANETEFSNEINNRNRHALLKNYHALSLGLQFSQYALDTQKHKMSPIKYSSAKCFMLGARLYSTMQLSMLKDESLLNFTSFQITLSLLQTSFALTSFVLPSAIQPNSKKFQEVAQTVETGCNVLALSVQAGETAYNIYNALTTEALGSELLFSPSTYLWLAKPLASYYQGRRINADAPESLFGTAAEKFVSVASNPATPLVITVAGTILPVMTAIPDPTVKAAEIVLSVYLAYLLCDAQSNNKISNAQQRLLASIINPDRKVFAKAQEKLEATMQAANRKSKINLNNSDHRPLLDKLFNEIIGHNNQKLINLYGMHSKQVAQLEIDYDYNVPTRQEQKEQEKVRPKVPPFFKRIDALKKYDCMAADRQLRQTIARLEKKRDAITECFDNLQNMVDENSHAELKRLEEKRKLGLLIKLSACEEKLLEVQVPSIGSLMRSTVRGMQFMHTLFSNARVNQMPDRRSFEPITPGEAASSLFR